MTYGKFLNYSEKDLVNQFHMYTTFVQAKKNKVRLTTLHYLLVEIPVKRFTVIFKLVRISATLPVTSCEPERCVSAMKILKSRVRSSIIDNRLNGLALMYNYPDLNSDPKIVVHEFALGNRKLEFVL